jgi:hypothetical protein
MALRNCFRLLRAIAEVSRSSPSGVGHVALLDQLDQGGFKICQRAENLRKKLLGFSGAHGDFGLVQLLDRLPDLLAVGSVHSLLAGHVVLLAVGVGRRPEPPPRGASW